MYGWNLPSQVQKFQCILCYCNRILWNSTRQFYKTKYIMACYFSKKSHRLDFPTLQDGTSWIHNGPMIWLPRFLILHPVISSSQGKKETVYIFPLP